MDQNTSGRVSSSLTDIEVAYILHPMCHYTLNYFVITPAVLVVLHIIPLM